MKWFFALNQDSVHFQEYANMSRVAVISAKRNTALEPYFIFDGDDPDLCSWMQGQGVTIIHWRSSLYEDLRSIAAKFQNEGYFTIGAGAFLRTELPEIAQRHNIADDYLLYTDCDVMFLSDVTKGLSGLRPKFFSVAPEFIKFDYIRMNTGVMVMNMPRLTELHQSFQQYIRKNLPRLVLESFDQCAYRRFFKSRFIRLPKWQMLPHSYNWKPYWGDFRKGSIVHFHGPKPYQKGLLLSKTVPPHLESLRHLVRGSYLELSDMWYEFLSAC